ncbi:MAG: hypothetical protein K6V97_15440 [Actinomycetia bacterium]|nr:hypothetical protein [Actinomycetes bacterium]
MSDPWAADRDDLLRVLTIRFGLVPETVRTLVQRLESLEHIERVILVAANASDWVPVLKALHQPTAFRVDG